MLSCNNVLCLKDWQTPFTDTMAIISAFTIIRALSLFHITAAYLFLTAPSIIADQNVVFILGESMRLVRS
jgi:hypothetical protein